MDDCREINDTCGQISSNITRAWRGCATVHRLCRSSVRLLTQDDDVTWRVQAWRRGVVVNFNTLVSINAVPRQWELGPVTT